MPDRRPNPPVVTSERWLVLLAVGALGVSSVMTQLALMRELLGAFSGNELVLGVVLGNWLLLMGIGTWLGRTSDKLRNPLAVLVGMQILVAVLPLLQVFVLRALRHVIFIRGAEVGVSETVITAATNAGERFEEQYRHPYGNGWVGPYGYPYGYYPYGYPYDPFFYGYIAPYPYPRHHHWR